MSRRWTTAPRRSISAARWVSAVASRSSSEFGQDVPGGAQCGRGEERVDAGDDLLHQPVRTRGAAGDQYRLGRGAVLPERTQLGVPGDLVARARENVVLD